MGYRQIFCMGYYINSSPPGQNGSHFTHDLFKCIFLNEKCCILSQLSLTFVPKGPVDNKRALVQVMAWRRIGDKPLSVPRLPSLLTHICGTRGRWVKIHNIVAAYGLGPGRILTNNLGGLLLTNRNWNNLLAPQAIPLLGSLRGITHPIR